MSDNIMENILPLEERSIYQVYLADQMKYKIPIYQRNYAWEEDEIRALVKDIYDSCSKNPSLPYYIGTLVTYKRDDKEYEVIDGQQRLTTIYIILKALDVKEVASELTYSSRKASASTLEKLDNYPELGADVDSGIRNGYAFAEKALRDIVGEDCGKFKDYFLANVRVIHYRVPKDVDLNHYFEVMNSRGEQLEKHEIVKSMLSQHLKDDKAAQATFGRIWEACSEMGMYIQQVFQKDGIYDNANHRLQIDNFDGVPRQDALEGKVSIKELLQESVAKIADDNDIEQNDRFQPIIDFPNFLLIVLKLTRMAAGCFDPVAFVLDDKELLNEFRAALEAAGDKTEFARKFAFNLLKAKFLLDNYIVHHTQSDKESLGDNPWKLQYYYQETSQKKYPKNLSDTPEVQEELVHLLSMFEVAFTAKQRKNYLFYCLKYLFDNADASDKDYLTFLRKLADKYFYDVYLDAGCLNDRRQPVPNAFDNTVLEGGGLKVDRKSDEYDKAAFEEIYSQGKADIPLFVFNYMDYKLWRKYADTLRGNKTRKESAERKQFFDELGCSDFELDSFHNFYFSRTRKSLEHYYPQAKAGREESENALSQSQINCFGNFAMIGADANSSGSNLSPRAKVDRYTDGKSDPISVASLKFRIMMQACRDNQSAILTGNLERKPDMEWNFEDIRKHQENMLDIIFAFKD